MLFKKLRGICLEKDCHEKATHFGIAGDKRKGLCDKHYEEFHNIVGDLDNLLKQLKKEVDESINEK